MSSRTKEPSTPPDSSWSGRTTGEDCSAAHHRGSQTPRKLGRDIQPYIPAAVLTTAPIPRERSTRAACASELCEPAFAGLRRAQALAGPGELGKKSSAAHKHAPGIIHVTSREKVRHLSCENTSLRRNPVSTGSRKARRKSVLTTFIKGAQLCAPPLLHCGMRRDLTRASQKENKRASSPRHHAIENRTCNGIIHVATSSENVHRHTWIPSYRTSCGNTSSGEIQCRLDSGKTHGCLEAPTTLITGSRVFVRARTRISSKFATSEPTKSNRWMADQIFPWRSSIKRPRRYSSLSLRRGCRRSGAVIKKQSRRLRSSRTARIPQSQ